MGSGRFPSMPALVYPSLAMCFVVALSNVLIKYPVQWFNMQHVLTYAAFVFPLTFLVNDMTTRYYGPYAAVRVVYWGCITGIIASVLLASPRIALASGTSFLLGQFLDIIIVTPLRNRTWWLAPLAAVCAGSVIDTMLFFWLAFSPMFSGMDHIFGTADASIYSIITVGDVDIPVWFSLAFGDLIWKILLGAVLILPYGVVLSFFRRPLYNRER